MPTTWNRWIRQEYHRVTNTPWSAEPTYERVYDAWINQNGSHYGLDLSSDDSLAYNMARLVWRADAIASGTTGSPVWAHDRNRRRAFYRFNNLIERARGIGLNVRHNRTLHGDVAWNVMRARWLEAQLGLGADEPVTSAIPHAETAIAQTLPTENLVELTFDTLTFGVEIECIRPSSLSTDSLAALITEAGVTTHAEHYNHLRRHHWKIVSDASVSDRNGIGCEIVSPVLRGEAGFDALRKVCDVLTAQCRINRTCGLHVHVGATGQPVAFFRNLLVAYALFEPVIDSFMSPSRRANANTYCQGVRVNHAMQVATDLHALRSAYNQTSNYAGRYRKVNLESFWRHSTVEFRHHQGTTEAEKAINWVRFCLKMCLKAAANATVPTTRPFEAPLDTLMTYIDADEAEKAYFARRQALLSPTETAAVPVAA